MYAVQLSTFTNVGLRHVHLAGSVGIWPPSNPSAFLATLLDQLPDSGLFFERGSRATLK